MRSAGGEIAISSVRHKITMPRRIIITARAIRYLSPQVNCVGGGRFRLGTYSFLVAQRQRVFVFL